MTPALSTDDDEDLEVFWDEVRQRDTRITLEGALRSGRCMFSVGGAEPIRKHAQAVATRFLQEVPRAIPLRVTGAHLRWPVGSIEEVLGETFMTWRTTLSPGSGDPIWAFLFDLLHASREGTVDRLRAFSDPLARHLAALHGRDLPAGGSPGPVFATNVLESWLWFRAESWGPQELELLGLDKTAWTVETMVPNTPVHRLRRLARLLLLGGVYGLFDRAVIYLDNLDALIRTPLKSSFERREEAERLDTLLTELERWKEPTAVRVMIGWSGHDEDAKLLRGLHEPLFEKVQASQVFV